MGKTQSKSLGLYRKKDCPEGECFVVNAHFNPLAVSDFDEAFKTTKTDSEITLSLSSCTKDTVFINRAGFADDKYPLKVVLPPESCRSSTSCMKEALERLDNEASVDCEERKDVTFQGLECDVSVQANVSGNEKQEFLFTLYDLDGYGKITKDDVAGLVKSIYEAMGSSLKVPPSGSKTIKVRLTVAPDRKMNQEEESDKVCSEKEAKQSAEDERERDEEEDDVNADADVEDDEDEEEEVAESTPYPIPQTQNSHHHHHHKTSDRPRRSSQIFSSPNNARYAAHYHQLQTSSSRPPLSSPRQQQHSSCMADEQHPSLIRNGSPSPGRKRNKVSFSSPSKLFQKNQLLEIIQANLEKNSFGGNVESSKRRSVDHSEAEDKQRRHHKWRQHSADESYKDGRSHYLDLAGLENYANFLNSKCGEVHSADNSPSRCNGGACPYEAMDSNHVCSKAARGHHACHKLRPHHYNHHRSRSHDLADLGHSFRYHLLLDDGEGHSYPNHPRLDDLFKGERGSTDKFDWLSGRHLHHHLDKDVNAGVYHARSKSYDAYYCEEAPVSFSPKGKMRSSKVGASEINAGSPHHHKHRNREKEHQRAMQQVASWIEKEHLGLRGTGLPPRTDPLQQQQRSQYHHHHHHHHHPNQPQPPQQPATPKSPERVPLVVERHEHHHIHEHYHHHYHHYHEL